MATGFCGKPAYPLPDRCSAKFADFLRLAVGGDLDAAEEEFRACVHESAEKFCRNRNSPWHWNNFGKPWKSGRRQS